MKNQIILILGEISNDIFLIDGYKLHEHRKNPDVRIFNIASLKLL